MSPPVRAAEATEISSLRVARHTKCKAQRLKPERLSGFGGYRSAPANGGIRGSVADLFLFC